GINAVLVPRPDDLRTAVCVLRLCPVPEQAHLAGRLGPGTGFAPYRRAPLLATHIVPVSTAVVAVATVAGRTAPVTGGRHGGKHTCRHAATSRRYSGRPDVQADGRRGKRATPASRGG